MKKLGLILVTIAGILLLLASEDLPNWSDPHSPAATGQSATNYIKNTFDETSVPNLVTAVLADYRGYDTMFETVVIFIAGLGIMTIIGFIPGHEDPPPTHSWDGIYNPNDDQIVRLVSRMLIPFIQLFAFYVVAHGHHSPGGGFQGGVIMGASIILLALSHDLPEGLARISLKHMIVLSATGVLIYSGFGLACLILDGNFLDYSMLHKILPMSPIEARSISMLGVEIGVAFTVASIMFTIYAHLSSSGHLDEGL